MKQIKLESTASLMMQWSKDAFSGEVIKNFVNHLDLTSGQSLMEECNSICDWYNQVVLKGKLFVSNYLDTLLEKSKDEHLIVIPGAGKSPLSLDILSRHPNKVHKIIEIDMSGMDEKMDLYRKFFPAASEKIKCITADVTSESILAVLSTMVHEFYQDIPCIILLEGITYFLSKREIEKIVSSFASTGNKNILMIEYLKPLRQVNAKTRHIPEKIFEKIKDHSGIKQISSFHPSFISKTLSKRGGKLEMKKNLTDLEKNSHGKNTHFDQADKGWIEYEIWNI
jgi:O-methyltransferase involved in polyketide biosynthesis